MKNFKKLINLASAKAGKKKLTDDVSVGRVACVLKTKSGKTYTGINVKAAGDLGFCAEVTALSQMVNDGETKIETLVGISDSGKLITPCGRCRELIYQLDRDNLKTKIVIEENKSVSLEELLPHRWQDYWGGRE